MGLSTVDRSTCHQVIALDKNRSGHKELETQKPPIADAATRAGLGAGATGTKDTCVSAPGSPASPKAGGAKGGAARIGTRFRLPGRGPASGRRAAKGLSTLDSGITTAAWIGPGASVGQGTVTM